MGNVYIENNIDGSRVIKLKDRIEIDLEMSLSQMDVTAAAAWFDPANKAAHKNMAEFCKDVADLFSHEFGFRILKEDQYRLDDNMNRVITEGSPSDSPHSQSLYYYVRYDMTLSDAFSDDEFNLSDVKAVIDCDFVIRVTDHEFRTESGLEDERTYDKGKLDDLTEQEGSQPDYREVGRKQIVVPNILDMDYTLALQEVESATREAIKSWRRKVKTVIERKMSK